MVKLTFNKSVVTRVRMVGPAVFACFKLYPLPTSTLPSFALSAMLAFYVALGSITSYRFSGFELHRIGSVVELTFHRWVVKGMIPDLGQGYDSRTKFKSWEMIWRNTFQHYVKSEHCRKGEGRECRCRKQRELKTGQNCRANRTYPCDYTFVKC